MQNVIQTMDMFMTLYEAIELFQSQVVNMDSLWAYYSTATLAVLGFTIASDNATKSRYEIAAIQAGYIMFAAGNAFALYSSQSTLIELKKLVMTAGGEKNIASVFCAIEVVGFQLIVTTLVLVIIEVSYRHKNKKSN